MFLLVYIKKKKQIYTSFFVLFIVVFQI